MDEYTQTNVTVDPALNRKVKNSALTGIAVPTVVGLLRGRPLGGLLTGLLTGFLVAYTGWYTEPAQGDGVLTIVEPEPSDDVDFEHLLREAGG